MSFPKAKKQALEQSISQFDLELRARPEWQDWEGNPLHPYAIQLEGKRYPAKKIVSLSTTDPVQNFTMRKSINGFLRWAGFDLVDLRPDLRVEFTKGEIYDRKIDIHIPFGGSHQPGISASNKTSAIFLFSGETGEQYGYNDRREGQHYIYVGEGREGPMTMTGGNLAILEHASAGRALHLFNSLGKGKGQIYIGEYTCESFSLDVGPDKKKQQREIIIFKLLEVEALAAAENIPSAKSGGEDIKSTLAQLRNKAFCAAAAAPQANTKVASHNIFDRCAAIKNYVRARARGKCESCDQPAPFMTAKGIPYLETHHTNRLSDGGLDSPYYVGAICPDCHREIHYGAEGNKKNEQLKGHVWKKEKMADVQISA